MSPSLFSNPSEKGETMQKGETMDSGTQMGSNGERNDLLAALAERRYFLRLTVRGITDEQAALHPTVSELCLGGLIKHVADVEAGWADFIIEGPTALNQSGDNWDPQAWVAKFQMLPGESLAGLLERYERIARRTDELVVTLPDLDVAHPLPEAPWFEKGASWSARRALLHIMAETAQHAGHADILR
jgi:hypothetical protein